MLWKGYFGQLRDVCCGRATLGLLRDHFGQCAVEELLWTTHCGRATLGYSGITLASVLWLPRDHSGECAVEGLLWATQGPLWPLCCGRATLGYSGITLASVLWKSYFGLLQRPLWGVLQYVCIKMCVKRLELQKPKKSCVLYVCIHHVSSLT